MELRLTRPKGWIPLLGFLFCGLLAEATMAAVERHALVIGNASYPEGALHNPVNDANGVAVLLRGLNFDVVLEKDLGHDAMQRAIRDFSEKLPGESLAVFYFAGHGTHKDEVNYLIPITRQESFERQGISVDSIIDRLESSESSTRVLILDACRTPPSTRSAAASNPILARGFASTQSQSAGTLVAYASAPGEVASDGPRGENGVFTAALLKQLAVPGQELTAVIKNASQEVYFDTDGEQNPRYESSLEAPVYLRPESPQHCLDLLPESSLPEAASPGLGRVWWQQQLLEPVLVWQGSDGFLFRGCSAGEPVTHSAEEAELFESALVTQFVRDRIDDIELYRPVQGFGYARSGRAALEMQGLGHMLEARRQQGEYVEVVGSASIGIIHDRKPILLIAGHHAMVEMDLQVWDEPWGARAEDSRIGRQIIWWQIEESGELSIHPAVESFAELASRLSMPGEMTMSWQEALEELADEILSKAAYSLLIAETADHMALAEALQAKAEELESATLDVAKLQKPRKKGGWKKEDLERLETTASRGRFWLLGRFFDLAAILPERIAGQTRFAYLKSNEAAIDSDDAFLKEPLILQSGSPDFHTANALYLDQAGSLAQRIDFLGCLIGNESYGAEELSEVLAQGLERMGHGSPAWPATTDVATAFNRLMLGLDLPDELPVGSRLFEGSVRRQSSELLAVLRSLKSSLASIPRDRGGCQIALLPDAALIEPSGTPLEIFPAPALGGEPMLNPDSTTAQAQEAKDAVRRILRDLIHVKGARHTREQMMRGYRALDRGNALLRDLQDGENEAVLQEALAELTRAQEIFNRAYEDAFRAEHTKPRVRVH